jgi:phosphoserine phosphatase RsbU/P
VVVKDGPFYLWAHAGGPRSEVVVLAPVTRSFLRGLVPNLGDVYLTSFMQSIRSQTEPVRLHAPVAGEPADPGPGIPPAANFLDLTILYGLPMPISVWDDPGVEESALLGMRTRISGVLNLLFNQQQWREQTSLLELLILIAIIFILVELLAAFVGISMTRAITGALQNLYEGTEKVKGGDLAHRIEVRGQDQLAELGRSFNAMTENLERLLRSEKERQRLQAELEIAREVQSQLHPREVPALGTLRLASVCNAARMVSGDYYDYQAVSERHLAIAIGDVAGKGISAALLMATLQSAMRSQLQHCMEKAVGNGRGLPEVSTARLVSNLNEHLYASTAPEKYATFFFSLYDEETGRLSYTNAGHLAPLLIRRGEAQALDVNGTVVGAFPNVPYDESHVILEPGDLLVCYTDGITEPENEYGEMFGEERLIELLRELGTQEPAEVAAAVVDAVRRWTSSTELQDDVTLVVAKKL